ncbi:uncharacterized protein [Montipora foliosa]|uniref:uncharacterized protein n=1 Tax=Montipora foliosa TaxID=591990 RepID=UPI0035F155EF
MATAPEYTEEQLNYFRICFVIVDVISEGLRTVFKQEWDNCYKATLGEWKDKPINGLDFKHQETLENQKRNAHLLDTMLNGNTTEWDCPELFYAILYSDSIGRNLNARVKSSVDNLRKFRNEEFAHLSQSSLKESDFQIALATVQDAFQVLGLDTQRIHEIRNKMNFATNELTRVLQQVEDFKVSLKEAVKQLKVLEEQSLSEVSSFCILPTKPSHDVTRRDHEVAEMMQLLKQLKEANKSQLTCLYISGNPGSGKSQLAGLVAEQLFQESQQMSDMAASFFVMTLNAETIDSLLASYVSFARLLKCAEYAITNTLSEKDLTTEKKIANMKSVIGTKVGLYSSWLLVVDNVVSLSQMKDFLPQAGNKQWQKGQMLITSQDTESIPPESSVINRISLSKGMMPSDATCLLANLSGIADDEITKDVARELDYRPLALASAATFLKQVRGSSPSFGWKDYLEKHELCQREKTEAFLPEINPCYAKSMTAAISLAVDNAMSSDMILNHAFNLISICAQQPLKLEILVNYILEQKKKSDPNTKGDLEDKDIIISKICNSSLLLNEVDNSGIFIRVHQGVRCVINSRVRKYSETQRFEMIDGSIRSFYKLTEDELPEELDSIFDSFHLVPHLKYLIKEVENAFNVKNILDATSVELEDTSRYLNRLSQICCFHCDPKVAKRFCDVALKLIEHRGVSRTNDEVAASVNTRMGKIHHAMGELQEAKAYYETCMTIHEHEEGHLDAANSYNNMATLLYDLGELQQAKEYFERALAIRTQTLGPQHVNVADSYNNLAIVLSDQGDLQQAKEYHERALAIEIENLGFQHVNAAKSCTLLSILHHQQGELKQARELLERALAIQIENLGSQHVDVANSYRNLANLFSDQGELPHAKEYHELALAVLIQNLGSQHTNVAYSYSDLATVLKNQGELQKAKEYYHRAHAILIQNLGSQHVDVAQSCTNLAAVLSDQGELQQAKDHFERALAIRIQTLGPQHLQVASSYHNMATVLRYQGELQQAKENHERAIAIRIQNLGPQHGDVADSYNDLAAVLSDQGELEQAKGYHERALAIRIQNLGSQHVYVADSYSNLGTLLGVQGELQQSKEYLELALGIRIHNLGSQHLNVAESYYNLATALYAKDEFQQAKEYFERALAIQTQHLGSQHVQVARSYNNLGNVVGVLGNLQQAKEYHERALAITIHNFGSQHVKVADSYSNVALLLHGQGELQQAKEHFERALAIRVQNLGSQHMDVAKCCYNMAYLLHDKGDQDQAKEYCDRALAIFCKSLENNHPKVIRVQILRVSIEKKKRERYAKICNVECPNLKF